MNAHPILIETLFIPTAPVRISAAQHPPRPNDLWAQLACSAVTLVLHILATIALLSATHRHVIERDVRAGVFSPRHGHSIEPFTLVELDEMPDTRIQWPEPPAFAASLLPGKMNLDVLEQKIRSFDLGEVEANTPTARTAEPVTIEGDDRRELYARYIAQIRARIQRAQESVDPTRSATMSGCRADIEQDESGFVIDVRLTTCDADGSWRETIIRAVLLASPLPAPPVSQLFSRRVTIDLDLTR